MAEGDDQKSSDEKNSCPDDSEEPLTLDLGIDPAKNFEKIDNDEECAAAASLPVNTDTPRREENPFSFKHFLRGDTTYQSQGARPKVYCDGRQIASVSDLELNSTTSSSSLDNKSTRIVSELSSGLPDFVQDHLVVEQSYLAQQATTSTSLNTSPTHSFPSNTLPNHQHPIIAGLGGGNLPDFTRDSSRPRVSATDNVSEDDSCIQQRGSTQHQGFPRPQPEFPLDLPLPPVQANTKTRISFNEKKQNTHSPGGAYDILRPITPESLLLSRIPDFLTDASLLANLTTDLSLKSSATPNLPVTSPNATNHHNGHHLQHSNGTSPTLNLPGSVGSSDDSGGLIETYRKQIAEQSRTIMMLNGVLDVSRQREQEWTVLRGKLEDDVEMSNIRAASAESTIIQLKQEIKSLSTQVTVLLRENSSMRAGEGASCNKPPGSRTTSVEAQVQHFAQELRGAASTAERNLRQLLSGVDNLRMMASYMESSFGVEDRPHESTRDETDNAGADFH